MKQYVITVTFDLKSTSVYGPFGSEEAAYDFLDNEVGEHAFSDTDFVNVREIATPESILEDFAEEEVDEWSKEGDNESAEGFVPGAYEEPVLTDDEKKYHTALYYYNIYLISYQLNKVYAVLAKGKDSDEYINELFWKSPEEAIQEMVDSDFSMVKSRDEVVNG